MDPLVVGRGHPRAIDEQGRLARQRLAGGVGIIGLGGDAGDFVRLSLLFALGFGVGLIGLVYVDRFLIRSRKVGAEAGNDGERGRP